MAQSKNNRKKSKRKNKNHTSGQAAAGRGSVQKARDWNKEQVFKFASLGVMIVGFVIAMIGGVASLIGYPITFLGAAACMVQTEWDTTNHKITKVVLCIFCILSAMQFVMLVTGNS
ncbi:MAG: hypothetical protein LUE11_02730 [Clostridia bacterium]|nr:hypothetical protein [Clostridia bacterium]